MIDQISSENIFDSDEVWMLRQEMQVFLRIQNGYSPERIIDGAVPLIWLQDHLARYRFLGPMVKNRCVLDMACGTGYGGHWMATREGARSVLGADLDADAVRYARGRYRVSGLTFTQADACTEWTEQKFTVIVSFETIEHVPAPDQMLKNVCTMLESDGTFAVSTPIRQSGDLREAPANPFHQREWSLPEFEALLLSYFSEVEWFGQNWISKRSICGLKIPGRLNTWILRLLGWSQDRLQERHCEVRPLCGPSEFWEPTVVVALCRRPIAPEERDATRIRKFSYGDINGAA